MRTNDFRTLSLRHDNKVYPSITPETRKGLCGCVEHIGPAGIKGWLLDCAASETHLKVDAYLDGNVLGSGYADRPRPNLSEIMGCPISCEFLIPWSATTLPPELKGMEQTAKQQIRVVAAESGRELHAVDDLNPTAGQLLDDAATATASLSQEVQQEPPPPKSDAEVKVTCPHE